MTADRPLVEYPCAYAFKAIGRNHPTFEGHVRMLVAKILGLLPAEASVSRVSSGGKYRSVTVYALLEGEEQRQAVYRRLHADAQVMIYF